jgi:glucosyl-3-phosphoglycerate phosphatase
MTRLVLVRHGETDWNAEGRWQGQTGTSLNALGRSQAEVTARHLASTHPDATLLARSDSRRVAETAAPLEALLDVPVLVDARLREIDVGRWSGRTRAEVQVDDPAGWAAYRRGDPVAIGGGETALAMRDRMLAALADVGRAARGGTAIVLTHGWALRVAVAGLLELDAAADDRLGRATNCSITELLVEDDRASLVHFASCTHLETALVSTHRGAGGR